MATGSRWRPWWNRWYTPYLLLVLLPLATFSISAAIMSGISDCIVDESAFKANEIALVLAPTAADLLPLVWLLSRDKRVRWSALIAGAIGAARFAIPMLLLINEVTPGEEPGVICEGYEIDLFWVLGMMFLLLILWGISTVLAVIAALITWPRSRPTTA